MIKLFKESKKDNSWEKPFLIKGEFLEHNEKEKYILLKVDTKRNFNKEKGSGEKKINYDSLTEVEKVIFGFDEEKNEVVVLRKEVARIDDCKKGSSVLLQPSVGYKVEERLKEGSLKVGRIVIFENKE